VRLTTEKHDVWVVGWSSDRAHLIVKEVVEDPASPVNQLYSLATVGGELEAIGPLNANEAQVDLSGCTLSPDGKALATFAQDKAGSWGVSISDPLGSPLRAYTPAPFARKDNFGGSLRFSPDGKNILVNHLGATQKNETWLLPYPAGNRPPRLVLQQLPDINTVQFSWMPDSRHIVASLNTEEDNTYHLWMADIESSALVQITTGTTTEKRLAVSPDGRRLLYTEISFQSDVVSLNIEDGSVTLISTGQGEYNPAWSARRTKLAWVTNRSGKWEIWVREADGSDRPVVTAADFPPGSTSLFLEPILSPDGERLIFDRIDTAGGDVLWLTSLSGGSPIRVDNIEPRNESVGSWSPDGSHVVYLTHANGKWSLIIAKATGNAKPVVLKEDVGDYPPDWSPKGDWISYYDKDGGCNLISPDGKASKFLLKSDTNSLVFSKDGKLLYGLETGTSTADKGRATLFSLDPATLKRKTIKVFGKDAKPNSTFLHLSVAPDGKSIAYDVQKVRYDLWMLQGFRQPGFWNQLTSAFRPSK